MNSMQNNISSRSSMNSISEEEEFLHGTDKRTKGKGRPPKDINDLG